MDSYAIPIGWLASWDAELVLPTLHYSLFSLRLAFFVFLSEWPYLYICIIHRYIDGIIPVIGFSGGTPDCVTTLQYQNVQENRLNTSVGATDSPCWPARDVMPEKRMIDGCTGEHKWRAKRQKGGYYYCGNSFLPFNPIPDSWLGYIHKLCTTQHL